jgi:Concanavalin A-like lectin/glucanases superfamily
MQDQLNRNPLSVTGTPALVTGALTVDPDQALQFNGTTNSASALDSTSLSVTGSLSLEMFLRLAALPGSTKDIVRKTGSYAVQVNSSGNVIFQLTGTATTTITSNVALTTNRFYHLVCVNNGNYSGVQQFGKTTLGATQFQVDDDNGNNKTVGKFTLLESALLRDVNLSLQYVDEVWPVQMCAVVYADNAGVPGALITKSDVQVLNTPTPQWRAWTWVNFPLTPAVVPAGTYHIGYVADTVAGPLGKSVLVIGSDTTGGTTAKRPDSVTGPSDPFGGVSVSTTNTLAAYCNYTAISRTGFEGKVLMYIDGARNVTANHGAGITNTANTLDVCPALAAQVDEISIWNKPLTSVQVATHYTAH